MSSPVTIRFNDNVLEKIKNTARSTSFKNNEDYSCSDLIRDAVQHYISKPTTIVCDKTSKIASPLQHTEDIISDMTGNELLNECGFNLNNPICRVLQEDLKIKFQTESIARKIFMVDEVPVGGLPTYYKTFNEKVFIASSSSSAPDIISEGEQVLVPAFEIAANPTIRLSNFNHRGWNYIKNIGQHSCDSLLLEEDKKLLFLLNFASTECKSFLSSKPNINKIMFKINKIYNHYFIPHNIIMNGLTYNLLRSQNESKDSDWTLMLSNVTIETRSTCAGSYKNANIIITPESNNNIYFTEEPDYTGVVSIPSFLGFMVMLQPEFKKLKMGLIYVMATGMFVRENHVVKIELIDTDKD